MTRFSVTALLALVFLVTPTWADTAHPIPADLLVRGDLSDKEVLRYRRIRVERQEILFDETQPMICRQGDTLLVVGLGGSLARSSDGGVHWETLGTMHERGAPQGNVQALGAVSESRILAAVELDCKGSKPTFATGGLIPAHKKRPSRCGKPRRPSDGETKILAGNRLFAKSRRRPPTWSNPLVDGWSRLLVNRRSWRRCSIAAAMMENSLNSLSLTPAYRL